jgi:hypothetical protein
LLGANEREIGSMLEFEEFTDTPVYHSRQLLTQSFIS